jgi:hypothetical protein
VHVKISRTLVGAIAIAVLLAGCTEASESPGASVTPAPTPVATQERETGLTAPAQPFGGDCAALMSDAEASEILGADAHLVQSPFSVSYGGPRVTVELHGGIRCGWSTIDRNLSLGISSVLLPADAVGYQPSAECQVDNPELAPSCPTESVVNGTRLSGSAYADSRSAAQSVAAAFLALFTERANAVDLAPALLPAIGAWALPVNCESVVAAGDFSAVPGLEGGSRGDFGLGNDSEAARSVAEQALDSFYGTPYCIVSASDASVSVGFVASGGGRWLESEVAAIATPMALDGYESAYQSPMVDDSTLTNIEVFDGPNYLHFTVRYVKNAKPFADALFAALDTTAAQ